MNQIESRKQAIYDFIESFSAEHHYQPSIREIGAGIGVNSTSMILFYLDQLIEDGRVGREEGVSRGVWVIKQ